MSRMGATNLWNNYYVFGFANKILLSSDRLNDLGTYSSYDIEKSTFYHDIMSSSTNPVLLSDFVPLVDSRKAKFALAQRFIFKDITKPLGFVIISIDKAYFSDLFKNTSFTSIDFLIIVDSDGSVIYSTNDEQVTENGLNNSKIKDMLVSGKTNFKGYEGRNFILNKSISTQTDWNVLCFSDEKALDRNLTSMNLLVILLTLSFIVLLSILSYFISSRFTKPVRKLMQLMNKAEGDNYRVLSDIQRNDEIGDLSRCFNAMMKKFLKNQVLRKEAEIEALQQQINPHFLYNTLGSIKSLATIAGNQEVGAMAEKLANMFRYNINYGKQKTVSIKEEINHIKNYIAIQKIRYRDKLDVTYEIDEEVYNYNTLKFLLQPIAENAIHYSVEEHGLKGKIHIKGYFDKGDIVFEINDNGDGIGKEELEQLNCYISGRISKELYKKTQSIGLQNIQGRISMFFGEEYGIEISSTKGIGTTVTIRIPACIDGGGDTNV